MHHMIQCHFIYYTYLLTYHAHLYILRHLHLSLDGLDRRQLTATAISSGRIVYIYTPTLLLQAYRPLQRITRPHRPPPPFKSQSGLSAVRKLTSYYSNGSNSRIDDARIVQ